MSNRLALFRRLIDAVAIVIVVSGLGFFCWAYLLKPGSKGVDPSTDRGPAERIWFYEMARTGHRLGTQDAPVVVLVFSHYRCGWCAKMNEALLTLLGRYPDHLAVVYKHFVDPGTLTHSKVPLGVECAARQGRFAPYHAAAFENRGVYSHSSGWRALADVAGIPDPSEFEVCVRTQRHADRIVRDREEGIQIGVVATPTFLINGEGPIRGFLTLERLDSLVARHFRGRSGP
jgi:protein-disulfide isomerase